VWQKGGSVVLQIVAGVRPSPGADVAWASAVVLTVWQGDEGSPGADVAGVSPGPGADVGGLSQVPGADVTGDAVHNGPSRVADVGGVSPRSRGPDVGGDSIHSHRRARLAGAIKGTQGYSAVLTGVPFRLLRGTRGYSLVWLSICRSSLLVAPPPAATQVRTGNRVLTGTHGYS
jgi:hypothetical protein